MAVLAVIRNEAQARVAQHVAQLGNALGIVGHGQRARHRRSWPTIRTIDRWDDATGKNLLEEIAGVGDYLVALAT